MTVKKYYGIRFLGGNRSCTTGTPNPATARMSIACDVEVFRSISDRNEWLSNERLSEPCGCGGGERIACTRREARGYNLGITVEDFNNDLENVEFDRYELE